MRLQEFDNQPDQYKIHNFPKLDKILAHCCKMVIKGQQEDPDKYGQVAACVIDPSNNFVYGINLPGPNGTRRHAERVAIDKYKEIHGDIPYGSIVVTTCSPCNSPMDERYGESCKDLLNAQGIHKVYTGYIDPTQHDDTDADFAVQETKNDKLWGMCQLFAQTFADTEEFVSENFADGKVRGKSRPGRVKRAGASCAGSVTDLRAKAKKYGGEKGKMYHWCANMKSGKKK